MNETPFTNRCEILSDLWLNYRDDVEFEDFIAYCDLALPLAYAINNGIITTTDKAETFINEAWALLLNGLGIEDAEFTTLDDVLGSPEA